MSDDEKDLKEGEDGATPTTLSDSVLDAFDEDLADEEGEEESEDEEDAWAEEMGLTSDSF